MKKTSLFLILFISFLLIFTLPTIATSLHEVVKDGTVDEVKEFINDGIDINQKNEDGMTPLMYAAKNNHRVEVIKVLLNNRANINIEGLSQTPLALYAAENENLDIIKTLVDAGMKTSVSDYHGNTALMVAAENNNNHEIVKYFIERGSSLEAVDKWGGNVFERAAYNKNIEVIRTLINYSDNLSADVKKPFLESAYQTALEYNGNFSIINLIKDEKDNILNHNNIIYAINDGNLELVQELLKQDINVNVENDIGRTPLMLTIINDYNIDIISKIIKKGANVNARDEDGISAIVFAAVNYSNPKIIDLLSQNNANLRTRDKFGNNSLIVSGINSNENIFSKLLSYEGLEVDQTNSGGWNVLFFAAKFNDNLKVIKTIANSNININAKDKKEKTALMLAAENNKPEVVNYLLDQGADGSLKDSNGKTAFDYAENNYLLEDTEVYWDLNDAQYE
jgi:ankyrin repeat protein